MLKSKIYTKELANALIELRRDIQYVATESAINWHTVAVIAPTHAPYLNTLNLLIDGIGFSCDTDVFKEFIESKLKGKGVIGGCDGQEVEVKLFYKEILIQKLNRSEAMKSIYEPILDSAVLLTELQARNISEQIAEKLKSKTESKEEASLIDKAPNTGKRKREGVGSGEVKESTHAIKSDASLKELISDTGNDNGKQHSRSINPESVTTSQHSWQQYVRDREQDSKKLTYGIV